MISVIVPVYKVEQYLPKCVDSIINQTYQDIEIILVDDGSPDNCPAICDEYARRDKRVKVIHKNNGGVSDARNAGINIAKGDYIIFLDGDDWLCMDSLENVADTAERTVPDIITGNVICYNSQSIKTSISQEVYKKDKIEYSFASAMKCFTDKGILWPPFRFIIKRSFIIENKLFFMKGILHEDLEWVPRALSAASSFALLNEPFYCYRAQRQGSITSNKNFSNYKDMLSISAVLYETAVKSKAEAREYVLKGAKTVLLLAFEDLNSMNNTEKAAFKKMVTDTPVIKVISVSNEKMKKLTDLFGIWRGLVIYAFMARMMGMLNTVKNRINW